MSAPAEKIWAYLHDQLEPQEKERFEQALQRDPGLRTALEEQRLTHEALAALSDSTLTDEQLEETLLKEWADEHPEFAEPPKSRRNIFYLAVPLAAAAAVIILLALPAGPIRWQRTAYGAPPQLRGEPTAASLYPRTELKSATRELQEAVEAACDPSEKWTLQISVQELNDGALEVAVSENTRVWTDYFETLEHFRRQIPKFAEQIANEL